MDYKESWVCAIAVLWMRSITLLSATIAGWEGDFPTGASSECYSTREPLDNDGANGLTGVTNV